MSGKYIQFKQERELGEILSVIFKFLRENYKVLAKMLMKYSSPAFVLLVAAVAYYSWAATGFSLFMASNGDGSSNFFLSFSLLILAYLIYAASMTCTMYHSIASYIANNGEIRSENVGAGMKKDFGKLLLLNFLCWIMIMAGLVLFIIPGIYLAIPLSLAPAILIFRKQSVTDSISECFQLVKDNWWMTFATVLCIGLLVYIIGLVFQIPAFLYVIVKTITSVQQGSAADPSGMLGTGYIIVSTISSMIQYIVYSITPIGLAFVYFHLNEKKHFTGTYESIQNLGNN